jgi:CRP-like cAMP-binding protein
MISNRTDSAWKGIVDCRTCGIRDAVLFADLTEKDFAQIHAPIDDLEYAQGSVIYGEGSPTQGIYTLRSGMIKLVRITLDGRSRIVRVLRAGDVVGLEALASDRYDSDAIALSPVRLCRIPLEVIQKISANSPRLHMQLMQKWQRALKEADDWLADMNFGVARQRVSNLILKMRGPDDPDVSMVFSREDMGAMLDLKLETVSREVSRLVRLGAIVALDKQGRVYRVVHPEMLLHPS